MQVSTSESTNQTDFDVQAWGEPSIPLHPYMSKSTRRYTRKTADKLIEKYEIDREIMLKAARSTVPFIEKNCLPSLKLSQGLVLVGGMSGQGKSTTSANIINGFLSNSDKRVVVISNEETTASVYNRIACIRLGYNFTQYIRGQLGPTIEQEIDSEVLDLMRRVELAEDSTFNMTMLEDVIAVLEYAAREGDLGMVVIDYLQTVVESREDPTMEPFMVSKRFGFFLKEYGRKVGVPIVVFAQLKPKSEASDMQSRIQNDKTIYNHAYVCVEVLPDFETRTTVFRLHKNRTGEVQTEESVMKFNNGKLECLT